MSLSFEPSSAKIHLRVLPVVELYFTHLPRSSSWTNTSSLDFLRAGCSSLRPTNSKALKAFSKILKLAYYHRLHGSQPCVNGDWPCQWEMAIFDHTQNPHPLTDHQKIGTGDYIGDPYGYAKSGVNPSTSSFWAIG